MFAKYYCSSLTTLLTTMPIITSPPNLLEGWPRRGLDGRSGPGRWTFAIIFMVMAVLLLLGAVLVLGVKLLVKPKLPVITVERARLDTLNFDRQQGLLREVQFSLDAAVENHNSKTVLAFSEVCFNLSFHDTVLITLASSPFEVPRKSVQRLNYTVARSTNLVPLDGAMEDAINKGVIPFTIVGETRTHWKEGAVVLVKTWTRVFCDLEFNWPGGTPMQEISCTSAQELVRR